MRRHYEDKQMTPVAAGPASRRAGPGSTGTEGPASPTRVPPPPTPPGQVELPPREPTDEELEQALEDVEADEGEEEAEDEGAGREDAETVPG